MSCGDVPTKHAGRAIAPQADSATAVRSVKSEVSSQLRSTVHNVLCNLVLDASALQHVTISFILLGLHTLVSAGLRIDGAIDNGLVCWAKAILQHLRTAKNLWKEIVYYTSLVSW